MPLPLIFLAVSGAVAAAARGASWLSERKVKQVNAEVQVAEQSANQKNEQYRALRNYWKTVFEARLAVVAEAYRALLVSYNVEEREAEAWIAEPWLLARMGELAIRRPLLVEPNFTQDTPAHAMDGYRMFQSGTNLARSNPGMGGAMQAGGFVVATGAYVTQQTNMVVDAEKYIAGARVYMTALRAAVDGFDARFQSGSRR